MEDYSVAQRGQDQAGPSPRWWSNWWPEPVVSLKAPFGWPRNDLVAGSSVHPDGFGFVTPETGGKDIYLVAQPERSCTRPGGVRIEGSRGRAGKAVIRILSRAHGRAGHPVQAGDTYYVEPEDEHLLFTW